MNRTPGELLIARSAFHFEQALLQLKAGHHTEAADSIERGLAILKEVTQ